jgi:hypothetical protein
VSDGIVFRSKINSPFFSKNGKIFEVTGVSKSKKEGAV